MKKNKLRSCPNVALREIDRTIPRWVDVLCPQCGGLFQRVDANTAIRIKDDDAFHSCGFSGPFTWINPEFSLDYSEEQLDFLRKRSEKLPFYIEDTEHQGVVYRVKVSQGE